MFVGHRKKSRGALLLLEIMLGMTLVTIALMGLFQLFPAADRSVGLADRTAQANYVARSLMEAELAKDYSELSTLASEQKSGNLTVQHTQRRGSLLSTDFHYTVSVTQPDSNKAIKDIVVVVGWPRGSFLPSQDSVRLQCRKSSLW